MLEEVKIAVFVISDVDRDLCDCDKKLSLHVDVYV